jgi:hypothetical protein
VSPITWVKGTTTWAALSQKLAQLVCGEVADDSSVTVASGDKWVREVTRSVTDGVLNGTTTFTSATAAFTSADVNASIIATGIPLGTTIASVTNGTTVIMSVAATTTASSVATQIAFDTIRTPSTKDVSTGSCSNRTGYFSLMGVQNSASIMSVASSSVCRVTTAYTSDPSSSGFHRWVTTTSVQTANSVSGNYSTATIAYQVFDADSGTQISSSSAVPNSAGSVTLSAGLVVSITDPSGFLTANTRWVRAFSATYMYGIDYWPMLYRQGATAPTFSVAPPGVSGTDYDIVSIPHPPQTWLNQWCDRSSFFHGLGIKTSTGNGSGALYTVSFSMALAKGRIFNSATAGQLSLDVGQAKLDTVNGSIIRNVGGIRVTSWCKPFQTAGSVSGTSQVQYWISVKNDGIMLVLNGDPGATGKLSTAWYGAMTAADTTYDVLPVAFNFQNLDFTVDVANDTTYQNWALAAHYGYWSLRRRQDGSEGSRDWQTKWMRSEGLWYGTSAGMYNADIVAANVGTSPGVTLLTQLTSLSGTTGQSGNTVIPSYPGRQSKPMIDGKWWLYGYTYVEGPWSAVGMGTIDETRIVRCTQSTRFLYIPGDGFGSGDELTDTGTSIKYLLAVPDYPGIGCRVRTGASVYYGGLAVAEL